MNASVPVKRNKKENNVNTLDSIHHKHDIDGITPVTTFRK